MPTDVEMLISALKKKAASKGYSVQRYQTNRGNRAVTVTYALNKGKSRPPMSKSCTGPSVSMGQLEGKTKRSEAYRKLIKLYNMI